MLKKVAERSGEGARSLVFELREVRGMRGKAPSSNSKLQESPSVNHQIGDWSIEVSLVLGAWRFLLPTAGVRKPQRQELVEFHALHHAHEKLRRRREVAAIVNLVAILRADLRQLLGESFS